MINTCNICGNDVQNLMKLNFQDIFGMTEKYEQHLSYCESCGFIFTANPFSEKQLSERYKTFSKFEFDADSYILDEEDEYKKRCTRQKDFIKNSVQDFDNEITSILEIGAASGYNLSLYKSNCTVSGIEPSEVNCKLAQKQYDVEMFCGTFEEYDNQKSKTRFDLIFLSHTLEHIIHPFDFIRKCKQINQKYMLIEVPTFDYKFVDEPFGMFGEEHVNFFTFEGLRSLMQHVGYRLVNSEIIIGGGNDPRLPAGWPALSTLWEIGEDTKKHDSVFSGKQLVKQYIDKSLEEMKRISAIIDSIPIEKKIAIWGTGHHASMLLANTSLSSKNIIKVYDSDIRKHGYFMAGKPIEAFHPSHIGEIDTIVIATYTAQYPIYNSLEKYKNLVSIVTLYS